MSVSLGVMCEKHETLFDKFAGEVGGFKRECLVRKHGRVAQI
jgi:hypothetical protein